MIQQDWVGKSPNIENTGGVTPCAIAVASSVHLHAHTHRDVHTVQCRQMMVCFVNHAVARIHARR